MRSFIRFGELQPPPPPRGDRGRGRAGGGDSSNFLLVVGAAVGLQRVFSCWHRPEVFLIVLAAATSGPFFFVGDGHGVGIIPARGPGGGGGGGVGAPSFMQSFFLSLAL